MDLILENKRDLEYSAYIYILCIYIYTYIYKIYFYKIFFSATLNH